MKTKEIIRIKEKRNAHCKTVSRKIEEEDNGKTGRGEATVIVSQWLTLLASITVVILWLSYVNIGSISLFKTNLFGPSWVILPCSLREDDRKPANYISIESYHLSTSTTTLHCN